LRLCAEDPVSNFSLSIGKVTDVQFPSGHGIRVDSHLSRGGIIGSEFDNMMAKIIVTASTFEACVVKAKRALADTKITGVKTNINLLRAIMADTAFAAGNADTTWLEKNLGSLVSSGEDIGRSIEELDSTLPQISLAALKSSGAGASGTNIRKGDAWTIVLEDAATKSATNPPAHHLSIDRITRNEFPEAFVADVSYTIPGVQPKSYKMSLASTTSSAGATASTHRRGDPNDSSHIVLPISGKLVEVLVEEGDEVQENQVIAFVKQMKMELEIRSPRAGTVKWTIELENEEGDDVAEGVLLAELESDESSKKPEIRSRL
jgi:acetyl/propionyl-CoA carboxylase alpha subunit